MHKIAIVGAGGIGRAVGLILAENPNFNCQLFLGDVNIDTANEAVEWIHEGLQKTGVASAFAMPYEGINPEMESVMTECDIVLDCLPGSQAPRIAKICLKYDMHYANLTEYVNETNQVIEIAKNSKKGFVLQTGLAPGFINVLGMKLFNEFTTLYKVDKIDKMSMKVGALTKNARAPHFYGFTWSPVGVATEYLKDCVAVRDGKTVLLPALSERETLMIDGMTYEDNLTSGGAADLPDALAGKVKDLDYKTLRYPGHYQWVAEELKKIPEGPDRIKNFQAMMQDVIPSVEDDIVIVYASVQGKDHKGVLRAMEGSYHIRPTKVGTQTLRAIQTTTAAPLAEAARMLLEGTMQGPVFQSMLDPISFMNGPFVSAIYGKTSTKLAKATA